MIAIYKRELKSYFTSMIGWVFMAAVLVFLGLYFYVYNMYYGYPYYAYAMSGTQFIFMLAIPILTMRSFAEERHSKTDQLLLTAPVSVAQIVLGKFLAMVTVFGLDMLIVCLCPLIIKSYGNAYLSVDYASIFLYFLMGSCYIAISMFLSSLTESQIIAAVVSYAVLILLYLMKSVVAMIPTSATASLVGFAVIVFLVALIVFIVTKNWFTSFCLLAVGMIAVAVVYMIKSTLYENAIPSLLGNFVLTTGFTQAVNSSILSLGWVVRYVSVIFFFCFLTAQTVQKRRWS